MRVELGVEMLVARHHLGPFDRRDLVFAQIGRALNTPIAFLSIAGGAAAVLHASVHVDIP